MLKTEYPKGFRFITLSKRALVCGLLLTSSASICFAQEDGEEDSAVYELNPFEVSTQGVDGYFASESTTGTRIATNIQELPFAVNVVTAEFFDDFAAYDVDEQFAYTTGFVVDGDVSQYFLRGFRASFQLRNGFARAGLFSKVTTNRAEVIKGPLAAIYGRAQPGGVVNYITKKPRNKPYTHFRVAGGSDAMSRVAFTYTGPLIKDKLTFRFDTSFRYEELPQGGPATPFEQQFVTSGVLQYKMTNATKITVEMDRTERIMRRASRVPIIYQDLSSTERRAGGKRHLGLAYEIADRGLNNLPGTQVLRDVTAINLMIEHRFNDVWTLRAAGDFADRWYEDQSIYSFVDRYMVRSRLGTETNFLINREPQLSILDEVYASAAADLLANFWTGTVEHKFLVTTDYYHFRNKSTNIRLFDNRNFDYNEYYMDVDNPRFIYTHISLKPGALDPTRPTTDPGPFREHNINTRRLRTAAVFTSWRTSSMKGKLITLLGLRRERTAYNRFYEVRSSSASIDIPTYNTYATTMQAGMTYKMTPEHYFFVGYSESYDPNRQIDILGNPLPDEEGAGLDVGFKSVMNDEKINITLTGFIIDRKNVDYEVDAYDPEQERFRTAFDAVGLVRSRGAELDFNIRLLDDARLNLFGGYGYNDTKVIDAGRDVDLVGRRWERVPLHMMKLGFRYSFRNTKWHGLIITGGVRYKSDAVFENGVAEELDGDPENVRSGNDGRREIIEPEEYFADFGASYSWKNASGYRHTIQANIKNAFDFDTPTNGGRIQDPRRFIVEYRIEF
jgi:outer membrane receptor protein involved in Fe transport